MSRIRCVADVCDTRFGAVKATCAVNAFLRVRPAGNGIATSNAPFRTCRADLPDSHRAGRCLVHGSAPERLRPYARPESR